MSKKKATSKNKAADKSKVNNTAKSLRCNRQLRVLSRLLNGETTVRGLFDVAGNNPAETVRQLRELGVVISLSWHKGRDQDGKSCRFGVYHLSEDSRESAKALIGG